MAQMVDRLKGMNVFAHVVEAKSFSVAATRLGISKSRVSREVSALERALAVKLLNRSTRKLSLTEGGAIFYEHCARIVQEAELAERHITQTQSEPAGLVRVTCVQAFALRHALPVLTEFQLKYPDIRINLSCSNRTLDLGDEGFDIGIRASLNPDPNLVARKLAANRKVLCVSPAYVARRGMARRIEDLDKHDCVLFPPLASKGTWALRRAGRKYSVPIAAKFETDDMDAVHAAVVAGLGVGLLPTYVAGADLQQGRLLPVLRQFQVLPEAGIYLVYLPNRTLPLRVRALIDFLVERFEPPGWDKGW
ncbi:MAG TPA: LysR family transcriptional regulator [Casimicrobiaceae bacterium]|jgi:DNA-binding transcriptional LysR family regulator